jgi:hypothetical protein
MEKHKIAEKAGVIVGLTGFFLQSTIGLFKNYPLERFLLYSFVCFLIFGIIGFLLTKYVVLLLLPLGEGEVGREIDITVGEENGGNGGT